uniref:Rpn family recombination-promoting nuclease/putative transposase n=1 Tax=uncultured Thiotrichaceae bacterium TaxID=298394 RepID=A0A6S6UH40_9GAMM|nr:MAG: conserved hypothetical protein [uncultured Thiotrichaceae bacterium]
MKATYISPLTDFGFKKLFGEEPNKDLLISFLNTLLPEHHQIQDLQYSKNEYQGVSPLDRKAIFDLSCVSSSGERFIVELQKVKQIYFKDRSVYYSTFAIQEQAKRGDWDYQLSTVYTIGILDFLMDEHDEEVVCYAQLKDQHNRNFYDKLHFIYIVLPSFQKLHTELVTLQDKWLYTFRHLHELDSVPDELSEEVFTKLFALSDLTRYTPKDRQAYEDSLKYYRDLKNSNDTAWNDGLKEGLEKLYATARKLLAKGYSIEEVADLTDLEQSVIQKLAE